MDRNVVLLAVLLLAGCREVKAESPLATLTPPPPQGTTLNLDGLKNPPAIAFTAMQPGQGRNAVLRFGDANAAILELLDATPAPYPGAFSAGFILYPRLPTGPNQNAPSSIFMGGWYDNGAGTGSAMLEIENKANWDGDGKPQLWLEIPVGSGAPFRFKGGERYIDGLFRTHDQPGSTLSFQGVNNHRTYSDVAQIVGGESPQWKFPHLAGSGNASLCINSSGRVYRGSPAC